MSPDLLTVAHTEHRQHPINRAQRKLKTSVGVIMMVLSKEQSKVLAQDMGWTMDRAAGYLEGQRYRQSGLELSAYLLVGIDDYARGFRAGYFERDDPAPTKNVHHISRTHQR